MIIELLSLIAAFCYTLSGIIAVYGMKSSNSTTATLVSMLTNLAIIWPLALAFSPIVFDSRAILLYAISAAFAPVSGRLLNFLSIERVGVSTTTSIISLEPIIVTILASVFLAEHFSVIVYAAIMVTVLGVVIIGRSSSTKSEKTNFNKWSLVLPFSTAFCYSSSDILKKEGLKILELPFLAAAVTCTFSTIYLFLSLLLTRRIRVIVKNRNSSKFFILSGLVNSVAWISSFEALNIGDASIVSTLLGAQPLIAIVLCFVLLRKTEVINLGKIIGALLVVSGVALISILGI